ncbi:adhesion G-protein coupled receptor G4-like [Protopterus annectens]|uniref:adhesion G-protein coupled receptor G4-like n=1 Tax=Protopterus annectens TaxID=7888 RepID=UPI001CF9BB0C|nr:adhesion G-protein coupled receptor G4-like [Protopterus annectens]
MRGQKIVFWGQKGHYVKLRQEMPANLCFFTLCLDLQRTTNTSDWTAFTYHTDQSKYAGRDPVQELGIGGIGNDLVIWLFGITVKITKKISLNSWHIMCLTWNYNNSYLSVQLNSTVILYKQIYTTPNRCLAPNGTLVLGQFHTWSNGINIIDGKNFLGNLYFFQLWNNKPKDTVEVECSEGNIIRWTTSFWEFEKLQPTNDENLRCARIIQPTTLSTTTTTTTLSSHAATTFTAITSSAKVTQPTTLSAGTTTTTLSSHAATTFTGITSSAIITQPASLSTTTTTTSLSSHTPTVFTIITPSEPPVDISAKSTTVTTTHPVISTSPVTTTTSVSTIHSIKTSACTVSTTIIPTYPVVTSSPSEASFYSAEVNITIEHTPSSFNIETAKDYVGKWLNSIFNNTQQSVQDFIVQEKQARYDASGGGTTCNNLKKRDLSSTSTQKQSSTISDKKSNTDLSRETVTNVIDESSEQTNKQSNASSCSQSCTISDHQSTTRSRNKRRTDLSNQSNITTIKQSNISSNKQYSTDSTKESKGSTKASSSYFSRIVLRAVANTDEERTIEDIRSHLNNSYLEDNSKTVVKALFPVKVTKMGNVLFSI